MLSKQYNVVEKIKLSEVTVGGPAYNAGLIAGDVLKEIEIISTDSYGNPTSNTVLISRLYKITDALLTARVGDTVKIKYERDGVENTASIVLTEECINEIK